MEPVAIKMFSPVIILPSGDPSSILRVFLSINEPNPLN